MGGLCSLQHIFKCLDTEFVVTTCALEAYIWVKREWGKEKSNKCCLPRQYVPTNTEFKKESKNISGKET